MQKKIEKMFSLSEITASELALFVIGSQCVKK